MISAVCLPSSGFLYAGWNTEGMDPEYSAALRIHRAFPVVPALRMSAAVRESAGHVPDM